MGAAPGKWITPTSMKKEGITLVELQIPDLQHAHDIIGLQPESYTPVSLVPLSSRTRLGPVPCCCVSIPSGFSAIVTKFGKRVDGSEEDKTWSPGFHCFWPWYSISRLVSRQFIVFDAPVKKCKTKDDIPVTIDIIIVFDISSPRDFVYGLGPVNLDSLLRATQEEVMRSLVAEIPVADIYDLFGDAKTENWVTQMNAKLTEYGVTVHSFTIRNVSLPSQMAQDFEDKTLYESKTLEKQMMATSLSMAMENEEEQQKLREECDNSRMAAEEQAVTAKAQISKEVREIIAATEKTLLLAEAQRDADVQDVHATGQLECAKIQSEIMLLKRVSGAQLEMEVGKLEAEAIAYEKTRVSQSKCESAAKVADGSMGVAEAEGSAAEAFSARREMEQEMARLLILENLGLNKKLHVVTSRENATGLAPDNSLLTQIANQGMEAMRMKLAEVTANSAKKLEMGKVYTGGLVRHMPQQEMS